MPARPVPYTSHELFPQGPALHDGIHRAVRSGYTLVPGAVSLEAVADLRAEADALGLETGSPVMLGVCDEAIPMAHFVAKTLAIRVRALRYRHPEFNRWMPTTIAYEQYDATTERAAWKEGQPKAIMAISLSDPRPGAITVKPNGPETGGQTLRMLLSQKEAPHRMLNFMI